ncbi:Hypothetical predicted protein [Olea europaea subsp. europaea]|uniref:Uncharacterized protein n=1 Tax=Olea europaea subsp. europaea TaxID=158383 RepID=A0A8S0S8B7_OLEEU|nr:Hypothetical predicted protein [Olea europaea subsp. europaea]
MRTGEVDVSDDSVDGSSGGGDWGSGFYCKRNGMGLYGCSWAGVAKKAVTLVFRYLFWVVDVVLTTIDDSVRAVTKKYSGGCDSLS